MITLEEKMSQFEELISSKIEKENSRRLEEKNHEINTFLNSQKALLEESAQRTAKLSKDRINRQKQEKISMAVQSEKRELLKMSEGFIKTMTLKIEDKCRVFVLGSEYPEFISRIVISTLESEEISKDSKLILTLAPANHNETRKMIKSELEAKGYKKYEILEGDISFIGGFVMEIPESNLRITKTLENSINARRDVIGQFIQNYARDGGTN
ncbi:hypothetical protein [Proteocatella sphenisci]|uniref:hypothetical protein n=1 Tax=Proteocatella sphenisci TaxID=181070 RepID=UPI00048EBC68|nr:hypothetical protein [Proteocatella sphenisci]